MLELRVLEHVSDVDAAAWNALVGDDDPPFLEHEWLASLEEAGCVGAHSGWIPRPFVVRRDGEIVAVAPAYLKLGSEGEFVFDWSWAEAAERLGVRYYPKLVFAVPFTPVTGPRVLVRSGEDRAVVTQAVAKAARELVVDAGFSGAHALFPPGDDVPRWEAASYARRMGVQYHWHNRGYATWDDFLATLTSKKRNQLRREVAQPGKDGVTIETLQPEALTPEIASTMFALYLTTVDKFMWGRRYLNEGFFQRIAERFSHRLAWAVARERGEIIASAFNAVKGTRLYGRYWGVFPNRERPFLHFNVCYYHGIRECIARGLRAFEPGAGGEHKHARGFDATATHSVHYIVEERLRAPILSFLARERRSVEAYLSEEQNAAGRATRAT